MKKLLYKIRSGITNRNWATSEKIKVLIETNKYFTKAKWNDILKNVINPSKVELMFFDNKYEGYKLIKDAQVMFSFGDNINYEKRHLQMQYYGISQPDLSNNSVSEVHYAKGISSNSVAEYCLAYSLIMLNDFDKYSRNHYNKKWHQLIKSSESSMLSSKTIGVVGLGKNGKKIAEIFKKIGCKVNGYDIKNETDVEIDLFCRGFNELLESSDIVISAVNLTSETKYLFNYESFMKMGKDSFLINVSRGAVINEKDLYKVLKHNKLAGAVLDVTADEPLSRFSKLWSLQNLIITPHISGNINRYSLKVMEDFSEKLKSFVETYV